jgi:hypothetical protein
VSHADSAEPSQQSIFDADVPSPPAEPLVEADLTPTARTKLPIGWSDIALGSLSAKNLRTETYEHANGLREQRVFSEVVKTTVSPHYRLIAGKAHKIDALSPRERQSSVPLIVDVIQRSYPGPVPPTDLHVRIVMLAIKLWYDEWCDGYHKNFLDLRRGDISRASSAKPNRYTEDQVPEALYAFSRLDIEREYVYEVIPGINTQRISDTTVRVIKRLEMEGRSFEEIRREREEAREAGTLKRGGRAWTLRVHFDEDFVRAATGGWGLGLKYFKAVRNLPLDRLMSYSGWKQPFFTMFDSLLEASRNGIVMLPWEHVWTSVMGGMDHAQFENGQYRRKRIHLTRSFLRQWASDEYVDLVRPREAIDGRDGVWVIDRPYEGFRPSDSTAVQSGDPDSAVSDYDGLHKVTIRSGFWIYLRRGANFRQGRAPQRREVWMPYLTAVGLSHTTACQLAEDSAIFDNIQGVWRLLNGLLVKAGDRPQRMQGARWMSRSELPIEDLNVRVRQLCATIAEEDDLGPAVPLSEMDRLREMKHAAARAKVLAPFPKDTEQRCEFLNAYTAKGTSAAAMATLRMQSIYRDTYDYLIKDAGLAAKAQETSHLYDGTSEKLLFLSESAFAVALELMPAYLWNEEVCKGLVNTVGDIYADDWAPWMASIQTTLSLAYDAFPFWQSALRKFRFNRDVSEVPEWEQRAATVLEMRLIEQYYEHVLLGLLPRPAQWSKGSA